jgi:hypothetical protein
MDKEMYSDSSDRPPKVARSRPNASPLPMDPSGDEPACGLCDHLLSLVDVENPPLKSMTLTTSSVLFFVLAPPSVYPFVDPLHDRLLYLTRH